MNGLLPITSTLVVCFLADEAVRQFPDAFAGLARIPVKAAQEARCRRHQPVSVVFSQVDDVPVGVSMKNLD